MLPCCAAERGARCRGSAEPEVDWLLKLIEMDQLGSQPPSAVQPPATALLDGAHSGAPTHRQLLDTASSFGGGPADKGGLLHAPPARSAAAAARAPPQPGAGWAEPTTGDARSDTRSSDRGSSSADEAILWASLEESSELDFHVVPFEAQLKLYDVATPEALPGDGLARAFWQEGLGRLAPWLPRLLAGTGALRPGCTLVTLDAVAVVGPGHSAEQEQEPPARAAEQIAAALLAGPQGAFFASQRQFAVACGGQTVTLRSGAVHSVHTQPLAEVTMPQLLPLAVVSGRPARLYTAEPMPVSGALNARIHGRTARLPAAPLWLLQPTRTRLPLPCLRPGRMLARKSFAASPAVSARPQGQPLAALALGRSACAPLRAAAKGCSCFGRGRCRDAAGGCWRDHGPKQLPARQLAGDGRQRRCVGAGPGQGRACVRGPGDPQRRGGRGAVRSGAELEQRGGG